MLPLYVGLVVMLLVAFLPLPRGLDRTLQLLLFAGVIYFFYRGPIDRWMFAHEGLRNLEVHSGNELGLRGLAFTERRLVLADTGLPDEPAERARAEEALRELVDGNAVAVLFAGDDAGEPQPWRVWTRVGDTNLNEHLVRQGLLTGTGELAASPPRAPVVPPLTARSAADIAWIAAWTFGWIVAGIAGAFGLSSMILRRPRGSILALLVLTGAFYQLGNTEGYYLLGPLVGVLFTAFFGRKLAVLRLFSEQELGGGAAWS